MEKTVFKAYIRDEIIQKTVIFSRAFNLTINKWHTNEYDKEHPYRVYFYVDNEIVGYIDAETNKIGDTIYVQNEFPFVLYTPLGKIKGAFSSGYAHAGYFVFKMPLKNSKIDFLDGLVTIIKTGLDRKYIFSAGLSFYQKQELVTMLNVGDTSSNYLFEIERYEEPYDSVTLSHSLSLVHDIAENHVPIEVARAKISLDMMHCKIRAHGQDVCCMPLEYKEGVPKEGQYNIKPQYVDFRPVYAKLLNVDPDLFKTIDATRSDLVFMANGITPVNLYDLVTSMAFDRSMLYIRELAHTEETDINLENNPVLKRMREQERIYYGF